MQKANSNENTKITSNENEDALIAEDLQAEKIAQEAAIEEKNKLSQIEEMKNVLLFRNCIIMI